MAFKAILRALADKSEQIRYSLSSSAFLFFKIKLFPLLQFVFWSKKMETWKLQRKTHGIIDFFSFQNPFLRFPFFL
jgi:hypothetical protein